MAEILESDISSSGTSSTQSSQIKGLEVSSDLLAPWSASTREWLIMITMAVSSLVVALDATILVPVLPTLASDLHGTTAETFWTGTSYLLTHAVFQPFIAALSDGFGRQQLLIPSLVFFTVGSIVCGLAHDFTAMLLGRIVQGAGGAGIISLSQMVFADLVPLRQRPKYFTLVLLSWAIGSVVGPYIGGLLVEKASWRWCFYINLPICGLALPMAILCVRLPGPLSNLSLMEKVCSVDWFGNVILIAGLTSLLVGISWGGVQFAWLSVATITPIVIGTIVLAMTILYEVKFTATPFLTCKIFGHSSTVASFAAAFLQGLTLYMALYYVAFYFSAARLRSPVESGVALFPATCLLLPGSAVVSALITRIGRYRWAIWTGWTLSILGCGMFIMWDENTKPAIWASSLAIFGLGMGMILSSVNFSIQAAVDPKDAGQAAAMYAFVRSLGMTVGVALGGTVFQNLMKARLMEADVPHAAELAKNAEGFVEHLKELMRIAPYDSQTVDIISGYVHGFKGTWEVMCVVSALGLFISFAIKHSSLDKVLESDAVSKK